MASAYLLNEKIKQSGKKKSHLADKLGVSRTWFSKLIQHPENFTYYQAETLCEEINVSDETEKRDIFLP